MKMSIIKLISALIGEGSYGRVFFAKLNDDVDVAIKKLDTSTSQEPDSDFAAQVCQLNVFSHKSNPIWEFLSLLLCCLQLSLVSRLKNDHFVELMGYCLEQNNRILVYQFATMGSLHDVLHGKSNFYKFHSFAVFDGNLIPDMIDFCVAGRKGVQGAEPGPALNWNQRVKIAFGAAKGLEYLHEKVQPPIVHRDVRSSNVLLFDDFMSKIADFNLSSGASDTAARLHSTRVLGTFGYHAPE